MGIWLGGGAGGDILILLTLNQLWPVTILLKGTTAWKLTNVKLMAFHMPFPTRDLEFPLYMSHRD